MSYGRKAHQCYDRPPKWAIFRPPPGDPFTAMTAELSRATQPLSAAAPRLSLPYLLTIVWVASVANATFNLGVYFVTKSAFEFSRWENLLLGVTNGLGYIPGALLVGPLLRRLAGRFPGFSTRLGLMLIMTGVGLAQSVPAVFPEFRWAVFPAGFVFNALSGAMWPVVESYLSGGRRAEDLRRSTSWFNVVWASTTFISGLLMAPLIEHRPLLILLLAGGLQILVTMGVWAFPQHPARHLHDAHEPHPPVYADLLTACRWLLPMSYLLCYCLAPILPQQIAEFGLPQSREPLVGATWGLLRWVVFVVFAVWAGWHGRWGAPIGAALALVAGFVTIVAAVSLPMLLVGLALFGVGMGGIYATALYYAMEVGSAEVEAGGTHEALIGLGFVLGPGLGAIAALSAPVVMPTSGAGGAATLTIGIIGVAAAGAGGGAARSIARGRRNHRRESP